MMKRVKISFLLIFLLLTPLRAQECALKFDHLTVDQGLSQNSFHAIAKVKHGFMWFGTWEGANRFDGYTFKVFRANEDDTTALSNNRINAIVTDSLQHIWISTGDQKYVFRFNDASETFSRIPIRDIPASVVRKFRYSKGRTVRTASNNSYIWVGGTNGLLQTNRSTGRQTIYRADKYSPFSLTDDVVNCVYIDDCENLWVGTQNGGVNHANLRSKPFAYHYMGASGEGLASNVVRAICQDASGKLWVGADNHGITVIHRGKDGDTYTRYGKDKLIDPNIRAIYCDRMGFVWIGTKGGLDKFDPRTDNFRHYYANAPGSICHPWVFWVTEDHSGFLWVGTFHGIAKYNRGEDRFVCYDPATTLMSPEVRVILEDHQYNLWVATEGGGISKLKRDSSSGFTEKLTPTHYRHIPGNENSLINDRVLAMAEDTDQKLWLGTNSGLCRFDPLSGTFGHYSVKNGFPDDLIMGILSDGREHIWISHKKGLTRMNIRTFETRDFNNHDGLQGNEFTQNAYYRNPKTGEMFFGGTNGLSSFFPDSISVNPYQPQPVLTALKVMSQVVGIGSKVNNRVVLTKSLLVSNEVTLTWWDKTFSLEFSALHYANPHGNKFKYMLEGFDRQWIYTDATMRMASYSHLPSGKYTFRVYAANSDGVWSIAPAVLLITVLPPWWLTWWAKVLYTIAGCTVVWLAYRYVAARIEFRNKLLEERLKKEKNEEVNRLKLQFFTEVSHEFRTPLTLILDPLERLIADKPDPGKVQYYYRLMHQNARQLLALINQLLDFRKLESGKLPLNLMQVDLAALIRDIVASFENSASEHNIRISVETSTEPVWIDLDTDKMVKIMNNLLSNALKFTPDGGMVTVTLSVNQSSPSKAMIEVSDTGVGMAPESLGKIFDIFFQEKGADLQHKGSGIGLAFTKELVRLHGGEITVESEQGKGSCFRVLLPCGRVPESSETTDGSREVFPSDANISNPRYDDPNADAEGANLPLLLVVDDNPDIRHYITMNFSKNYRVATAADGYEGFSKACETIPDLIISDIMMPGISGTALCRQLKTDERTCHIPVILLTARQSDESKVEGYETGADAYITKPFSTMVLQAQMSNLLEQRQRLRQLFAKGSQLELKKIAINITDEAFLNKVVKLIDENMEKTNFDPDMLAEKLKMSRSQLYRKIKAMTNQTVHDFITTLRMNKALEYLLSGECSISETAYKVGYSLPTNFTRSFVKQFGATPSSYITSLRKNS